MTDKTYKTTECNEAHHFVDDLYFCKCNHPCEYKITIGTGRYHSFCFLRLDGVREMVKESELEEAAKSTKNISIRDFIKKVFDK